ncbi:MAG TPA: hypothetical protein PLG73_11045 [Candidatus Sumerlaeota bacterium]|nr:hypothetical protein [Candidatus Sumerlaeota bacterium]
MGDEMGNERPTRLMIDGWCSLAVPTGWAWNQEEGITSVYREAEPQGALNISLYFRRGQGQPPSRPELVEYARKLARALGNPVETNAVGIEPVGQGEGSYVQLRDNLGDRWRIWHTGAVGRVVCLAYQQPVESSDQEHEDVERMVRSFQWLEEKPVDL